MDDLFEDINIQYSHYYCCWGFKYKGQAYMNIVKTKGTTAEKQILVVRDMTKCMKALLQRGK